MVPERYIGWRQRSFEKDIATMPSAVWIPTEESRALSNLTAFMACVEQRWGVEVSDYQDLHRWSISQPEAFWATLWDFTGIIAETRGDRVVTNFDSMIDACFFPDARLNFAENLLRREDESPAIISWREDSRRRVVSHRELRNDVSRMSQAMSAQGIGIGSRVAGVLPNLPEALVCMLAANSLGAIWTLCSPDFGARGIIDRIGQIEPELLFIADAYSYKGKRQNVSHYLQQLRDHMPKVKQVVVLSFDETAMAAGRKEGAPDGYEEFLAPFAPTAIEFQRLPFDQPAFILYTSGTTGNPKCIVHGSGGILVQLLKEHYLHFDLRSEERFFYFTTTGWNMWYTLVTALGAGGVVCMYEGSPFHPDLCRLFDFIEHERINLFGTSPKYIETLLKSGAKPAEGRDLGSLETVLSTGAPLLPHHYDYLSRELGPSVRVSSISGGTELMTTFANGNPLVPVYPGEMQSLTLGMKVEIFDEHGRAVFGEKGELVCAAPFPSRPICFANDPGDRRYHDAYYERFENVWTHGDLAEITPHNGLIIYGRSDAVLNPGGVRIGTAEIYRPLDAIEEVVDAIVVGREQEGNVRIVLFVQLAPDTVLDDALISKIKTRIRQDATPRHVPNEVIAVDEIPYTVNGKKVELAVREILHDRPVKNVDSLANPRALKQFMDLAQSL